MSQLILFLLIAVAGWLAWRTYKRESARLRSILRDIREIRQPPPSRKTKVTQLEIDPKTGEYRPVKDD